MVYGKKKYTFKFVLKSSAKVLDKYIECVTSLHYQQKNLIHKIERNLHPRRKKWENLGN